MNTERINYAISKLYTTGLALKITGYALNEAIVSIRNSNIKLSITPDLHVDVLQQVEDNFIIIDSCYINTFSPDVAASVIKKHLGKGGSSYVQR